ncbi:hypothetical protein [Bacteroides pyogenes]|uniref:IPT/TIG domain-containing protein n=1 Tax=Bacteroides pyogenes TaxID=310300 RepID=A0A5D3EAP4_9BACE|nr:hypothetical protein [Bacteroides pyogenes]MBR8724338.1 hypothetical protein [Bacteroides pyogenes]MBR8737814.1 hypothetical protein [Bacteroides pyogenes]MBR8753414.1 hypothetical protein [Bacteroides pyogenes]MBR8794913.1 hypothetical protein [Bacteroides pyogenes]MBR8808351.1 hypothetical protein [Bacteroides pyogenes]
MRNTTLKLLGAAYICCWAMSCSDKKDSGGGTAFNPNQDIVIEDFYPDSGGIATPMIIEGKNFGADTTGLSVYFVDEDQVRRKGGLVSSNGEKLYVYVPSGLTYKRNIDLVVERKMPGKEEVYSGKSSHPFIYKTQTSVTTVIGQVSTNDQPTKAADLNTTTLSAPGFICLDDEDNIFIVERTFSSGNAEKGGNIYCKKADGNGSNGNVLKASLTRKDVVLLSENQIGLPNAPTFSDEKGLETVYVPADFGMEYLAMSKALDYQPRKLLALKNEQYPEIDKNNWKYSFVVNKNDKQIYTVMYNGQLVRINPKTRRTEVLLKSIGVHGGGDTYISFSPIETNKLFICLADKHEIWTVDIDQLEDKDINEYHGEPYAGKACWEGIVAGKGWEDGLLKNAKFKYPRQICFTKDGKLYIADSGNCCIRTIDTTLPQDKATVTTAIGIPGSKGHQDGGPDIAKFNFPFGVAVSQDGQTVYVADTYNRVIRKLSIE